ncbi:MAG: HlyD family efflux transporter periplasmic adaptor subunit [Thalassolituus sp.]|uniref:HlyD family secretion protein n=1 Tax=Thalassolituus sp. TaxID=2030822 RepID=UPI0039823C64
MKMIKACIILIIVALSGCNSDTSGRALGSLERDRITLSAPASEVISAINVSEGQTVATGDILLQLNTQIADAKVRQLQADVAAKSAQLAELQAGARSEERLRASSQVNEVKAHLLDAEQRLERTKALRQKGLIGQAELDSAKAQRDSAAAQLQQAEESLLQLTNGTRPEQITQAQAILAAAQAALEAQQKIRDDLTLKAPIAGRIDISPWHVGDRISAGTVLLTLMSDGDPFVRVYLPQNRLAGLHIGSELNVDINDTKLTGKIRNIRADPVFTPYYALNERDRTNLMHLTDIVFAPSAIDTLKNIPDGIVVEVMLP